jgi:hypothetical protein
MGNTFKIFAMLLVATALFHYTLNMMLDNIEEYETVPLPPKKKPKLVTYNPVIKVNASSKETWTLVDFSTGKTYKIADPEKEKTRMAKINWDLGFQRTKIITNGGITNPNGQVGVINLGTVKFDDIRKSPETGFLVDSKSFGKILNKGIADWYNYRTRTHNVESRKNVYVVRTSNGQYMKMRILNYYCKQQESECKTMMCSREDAACLTIEYVLAPELGTEFPIYTASSTSAKNSPQVEN